MKSINDIYEGIFDNDAEEKLDKDVALDEIWQDLTTKYGEILLGSARGAVTVDNIDLDNKGRIIFKNWPGPKISFYLGSIDSFPESVQKRGFGELPKNVKEVEITEARCKLSQLGFRHKYPGVTLSVYGGNIEMDTFPKFDSIDFRGAFFTNTHILPKPVPRGMNIFFNESSIDNIFSDWCQRFFKGAYPMWDRDGGQKIKL